MVPPCLYRISIPLHLMITESPDRIRVTQRWSSVGFRLRSSQPMASLSANLSPAYSSLQRVAIYVTIISRKITLSTTSSRWQNIPAPCNSRTIPDYILLQSGIHWNNLPPSHTEALDTNGNYWTQSLPGIHSPL